jgi:processive 1,2-diacylglycerol beta-glucosyltransferase
MAGWSFRVSAVERMIDHLGMVDGEFQLVVLAGRNKELYERVKAKQSRERRIASVFEFIDFVENLMRLSDILISKPGGITTAESLAAGLPMIVVDPIPGQEEANSDYILENGAGLKARSLEGLVFKINHLMADPACLAPIRENIRKIARPDAAFSIADAVARSLLFTP